MSDAVSGSVFEQLAYAEHASWARWMLYLFSKAHTNPDGSCTIPAELAQRWKRQADASYDELSETEKESDRQEVWLIMPLIVGEIRRLSNV